MYHKKYSVGMTLIELMFSLVIGFLIISGMAGMYLTAENNEHLQSDILLLQDNAMTVTHTLTNRLRGLAFTGCARLTDDFPFKNHLPFPLNPKNRITMYESSQVKPGTDAIRIWSFSSLGDVLLKKMQGHSALYISSSMPVKAGDYLVISDCKTTETFKAADVYQEGENELKIIPNVPLEKLYDNHAEINQIEMDAYFIGKTDRLDQENQPIYTLFSEDIQGERTELAENVSQMKIFFSIDKNNVLMEFPVQTIKNSDDIKGVSFDFDFNLTDLRSVALHKKWNVYVALS